MKCSRIIEYIILNEFIFKLFFVRFVYIPRTDDWQSWIYRPTLSSHLPMLLCRLFFNTERLSYQLVFFLMRRSLNFFFFFTYQTRRSLITVLFTFTGSRDNGNIKTPDPVTCPNCGRHYSGPMQRSNLNKHLRLECGKDPMFSCAICSRRFTRNENLKRHLRLVHMVHETLINNCSLSAHSQWTWDRKSYSLSLSLC